MTPRRKLPRPAPSVLLIDPQAGPRSVIVKLLKGFGCEVTLAASAEHALDLPLAATSDIALLDAGPLDDALLGAIRALKDVRGAERPMRVIVVSAYDAEVFSPILERAGCDAWIHVAALWRALPGELAQAAPRRRWVRPERALGRPTRRSAPGPRIGLR